MSTEIVEQAQDGHFIPRRSLDRVDEILAQARGIAACIGVAAAREGEMRQGSIGNATWAVEKMLDEVERLVWNKQEPQA